MTEDEDSPSIPIFDRVRHLDLKEIAGRLVDREVSVRGLSWHRTEPGMRDLTLMVAVAEIKHLLAHGAPQPWRLSDVLARQHPVCADSRMPAALKRLQKMKQLRIGGDADGALIWLGEAWIEQPGGWTFAEDWDTSEREREAAELQERLEAHHAAVRAESEAKRKGAWPWGATGEAAH